MSIPRKFCCESYQLTAGTKENTGTIKTFAMTGRSGESMVDEHLNEQESNWTEEIGVASDGVGDCDGEYGFSLWLRRRGVARVAWTNPASLDISLEVT